MNRELSLPDWGPYSRHYMGISRIVHNANQQQMIDFVLVPGYMRGRIVIPDVNFDSGYHPWASMPDFSYYAIRYDLQWKDQEYCHAEYFPCARGCLVKLTYVNNTSTSKEYSATCFAVQRLHESVHLRLVPEECWISGQDYVSMQYAPPAQQLESGENYETFCHLNYLHMEHDGLRRGVTIQENLVDAAGLGNRLSASSNDFLSIEKNRTFLMNPHTKIVWKGDGLVHRNLYLRFSMAGIETIAFTLTIAGKAIDCRLHGEEFPDSEEAPALIKIPILSGSSVKKIEMFVQAVVGDPKKAFLIDGFLLTDEDSLSAVATRFSQNTSAPHFSIHRFKNQKGVALTSARLPGCNIGMYSNDERPRPPFPYSDCSVTNVYHSDLSGSRILRKLNNDSLLNWGIHNCQIYGDAQNHFAGYHAAPIVCHAGERRSVYFALICEQGELTPPETLYKAEALYAQRASIEHRAIEAYRNQMARCHQRVWKNAYSFGQERLMCNLLSNVTFPVYIRSGFYKTYTPGKRWGGLFTWDSGMLGIGLCEYAPEHAAEILSQYFPAPEETDIDAVLHGTQLPLHIYLLFHLYQKTGDKELLRKNYPSALRYYRYFAGISPLSNYDKFASGLLCPFEDGYNAEGVDDYPPQHYAGLIGAYDRISPACTSAHAIRAGKLMALMAAEIGMEADIPALTAWIKYLTHGLQTLSWDETNGYFSYVWNDSRKPLYYDEAETINFNMGIDGISPLLSGELTEQQLRRLKEHITTLGEMWTPFGVASVDLSAPYARRDGYWNGKIWMPHQWFFYKSLITEGELGAALQIARTALNVWERSVQDTYNCYEQFCSITGMGEGCHNFGGLSGPVAAFYFDLYEKYRVTAGFDSFVSNVEITPQGISFLLRTPMRTAPTGVIVCVGMPGYYRVDTNYETLYLDTDQEVLPIRLSKVCETLSISVCFCQSLPC